MIMPVPRGRLSYCIILVAAYAIGDPASAGAQNAFVKTTVAYREVDGHRILADVHRPNDEAIRPVIVWIHGGALMMGNRQSVSGEIMKLAKEKGYAIVSIDYRLAPETELPGIISDVEAAFRWLADRGAERFRLDPGRLVVCGGSAGGYLTLVTGYRVQPKPTALVSFWGYGDLVGDWYSKPSTHPRHNRRKVTHGEALRQTDGTVISDARQRKGNGGLIYLYCRQTGTWPKEVSGFDPVTQAEKIAPYEPVRNVTKNFPPTLLIHGTRDTDVPVEQSRMMASQFKQHGVPHILKLIDNGEHGLGGGDPRQIQEAYKTVREFIVQHLDKARTP